MSEKRIGDLIMEQAQAVGSVKYRLEKTQDTQKAVAADLQELLSKESEGEDIDATEKDSLTDKVKTVNTEVKSLQEELAKAESRMETLKELEQAQAKEAKPIEKKAPGFISRKKDPNSPTDLLFRTAAAEFIGFVRREHPLDVLKSAFGDDAATTAMYQAVQKTTVSPADTTTAGWASELTREATAGLLDSLEDVSVAAALQSYAQVLNFQGASTLKVPRVNNRGAVTEPAWVN